MPLKLKREKYTAVYFTLTELLIVIAIIAVLLSMLLPGLNKAKEAARRINCCDKIKHVGLAVNMYSSDYNGFGPTGTLNGNTFYTSDTNGCFASYLGISYDYYSSPRGSKYGITPPVVICKNGGGYGNPDPRFGTGMPNPNINNSYALNENMINNCSGNMKRVINPSGRMLVLTAGIDGWNNLDVRIGGWTGIRTLAAFRHVRRGNFAFVDGHVETRPRDEVPLSGNAAYDKDTMFWNQY